MSGIVIYSSFFPNDEQLFRGIDFLNMMKNHFSNYRIYIGIQLDSIPKWKEIISEYKKNGLDITYDDINPKLYVNSDVSGYQKALELLYKDPRPMTGDFVWFGHSKGVTTKNYNCHNFLLKNFWGKKYEIETRLNSNEIYGCFGNHISFLPEYDKNKILGVWKKYSSIEEKKESIRFMFINTLFVLKTQILKNLFENINPIFFTELIVSHHNIVGDRYFFERDFIHFVDIMGYIPIFDSVAPNVSWRYVDRLTIENEINLWMKN
jgi:hypothetical protein